jgi:glutathione S-transferase
MTFPHPLPEDLVRQATVGEPADAVGESRRMMVELWQTEWCPASRRIRQRLTELGVDYVVHQVPVEQDERNELRWLTGAATIPVIRCADGRFAIGEDEIRRVLDERVAEPEGAEAHRLKAEKARRRALEEECECSKPATR